MSIGNSHEEGSNKNNLKILILYFKLNFNLHLIYKYN